MFKYFFVYSIVLITVLLASSKVHAETFNLKCAVLRSNFSEKGGVENYIVDLTRKIIRYNCEDCPWHRTLYWGDDYIVFINSDDNMGTHTFYQSKLHIFQLESMIKYSVFINGDTFSFIDFAKYNEQYEDDAFAPIFNVMQCSRNF